MTISSFHSSQSLGNKLLISERIARHWNDSLRKLPERSDLFTFLVRLEKLSQFHANPDKPMLIGYDVWKRLSQDTSIHPHIVSFLTPKVFLSMPKVGDCVSMVTILSVITRTISAERILSSLSSYSVGDPTSQYITSIDSLEDWLFQMSKTLVQITKMTEQFVPLWVFTAAHTIAFFHGSVSNRVKIHDFLCSKTLIRLLELGRPVIDMDSNPFSRLRAVQYYDSFTVFDSVPPPDHVGSIFAGGYMSPLFMSRLFHGEVLDYRKFLTFAIAWDNRNTEQGLKYFWPVFDPESKGYITRDSIELLVSSLFNVLRCLPTVCGPQGPRAEEILTDEIFDIFADTCISKDKVEPEMFGTVVGLLGNTQTFIKYEGREDTAHFLFVARQTAETAKEKLAAAAETRTGQLAIMQELVDACQELLPVTQSFAEFLDYHESVYGGESMEPWLAKYYLWETAQTIPREEAIRQEETSPRE